MPGQPVGTLGVLVAGDSVVGAYITESGDFRQPDAPAMEALAKVPTDGARTRSRLDHRRLPGARRRDAARRAQRARAAARRRQRPDAATRLDRRDRRGARGSRSRSSSARSWCGRALAPLAEVTATAQRRLRAARSTAATSTSPNAWPTDDGVTEVGRLGAAFNRMLGHVASALSAREQSEQKVRRFVADASHELRTPLASIRGYAELTRLHGGELPPDVMHAIGRIESESVRMTELVEDLLLLARLDEGRELAAPARRPRPGARGGRRRRAGGRTRPRLGGATAGRPDRRHGRRAEAAARSSRTCSRTPGCTRPTARASSRRSNAKDDDSCSRSPTTARASPKSRWGALRAVRAG